MALKLQAGILKSGIFSILVVKLVRKGEQLF